VTQVCVIIGRASCFGVWIQYIFEMFTSYQTTIMGFSAMVAGVVNLSNYLWTYLAKKKFGGSYLYVDIGMAVAISLGTLFITSVLSYQKHRANQAKARIPPLAQDSDLSSNWCNCKCDFWKQYITSLTSEMDSRHSRQLGTIITLYEGSENAAI